MAVEIITKDDLQVFRVQLLNDIKQLLVVPTQASKPWLRSHEVRKLLKISAGTLQKLRIEGVLRYTKVGTILYYRYEDIVKLLESNMTA
ncbi:MAG: helix-turn-helix domain-containing protein [Bacteroidota bacterium]